MVSACLLMMNATQAAASDDSRPFSFRAALVAGAHGLGGEHVHPYGGLEAGALYGRYGLMGIGQYGSGGDFDSVLVGGGPAVKVADLGFASVTAHGGLAWYQEEDIPSGVARDLTGGYGGVSLRVPVGFGAVAVTGTVWRGTADGAELETPISGTGYRLSFGFGL